MKTAKVSLGMLFIAAAAAVAQTTYTCGLQWESNSESDLGGYRVYFGQVSNVWTHAKPVAVSGAGKTTATMTLPGPGVWYFMVTATNLSGLESLPSNVVSYETPGGPPGAVQTVGVTGGTVTQVSTITTITNLIWVP